MPVPLPHAPIGALAFALLLTACGDPDGSKFGDSADSSTTGGDSGDPADTGAPLAEVESCGYTAATDLDPSEEIIEIDLLASAFAWDPGTGTPLDDGLLFNQSAPGSLIEGTLGQVVRVHFTNDTEMDLSIHWHGLRLRPEMDGVMQMMDDPVSPGESFDYEFELVDAGFYWYHPHMNTDLALERGLVGPIIVHTPDEVAPDCDLPVVLDDILLDEDTLQIVPPDTDMMQLMGRLGNLLMANDRAGRRIAVQKGETMLLRFVVASNARFWDLYLEGHDMTVVATDGGFLAEPYAVESLVITPGERYIVKVEMNGEPGAEYRLMNKRFQLHDDHADMVEVDPMGNEDNPVMSFVYGDEEVVGVGWTQPAPDVPNWTGAVENIGHHWILAEDMMGGTVTIDGAAWPDVPMVTVDGDTDTTFEIENISEMHHPFHPHGNRFQVVDIGGERPANSVGWKDTWDVPPYTTVKVVANLDNPGEWMYHCHILEHAEDGMMGLMTVGESEME